MLKEAREQTLPKKSSLKREVSPGGVTGPHKRLSATFNSEANEFKIVAYYGRPQQSPEAHLRCFYTEDDCACCVTRTVTTLITMRANCTVRARAVLEFDADAKRKLKMKPPGGRSRKPNVKQALAPVDDVESVRTDGSRKTSIFGYGISSDDENTPMQHPHKASLGRKSAMNCSNTEQTLPHLADVQTIVQSV